MCFFVVPKLLSIATPGRRARTRCLKRMKSATCVQPRASFLFRPRTFPAWSPPPPIPPLQSDYTMAMAVYTITHGVCIKSSTVISSCPCAVPVLCHSSVPWFFSNLH